MKNRLLLFPIIHQFRRIFLVIAVFFVSQVIFGQGKKETIYIGVGNQAISKRQFKKFDPRKTYVITTESDTATIKKVFSRKNYGKLDSIQHNQLAIFLSKIIGPEFDANRNTMIHLYEKTGKKVKEGKNYEKYWQWIKNNSDGQQAFLIGTKNSGIEVDKENHLFIDSYDLLKNLFFSTSPFEMNHLYLKPNGEFYMYYGGKDILGILDWSV